MSTAPPVISGNLQVGQTLSVTNGQWSDPSSPIISYSYEWLRCVQSLCVIIPGATSSTYTLQNADDDDGIDAGVIAYDEEGHFTVEAASITDTITDPGLTTPGGPEVLPNPQSVEAPPAARQPANAIPAPEADAAGSSATPSGVARLLTIHEAHRRVQAQVGCEQAILCRLSLAVLAGARGHALIAQRSFTVEAQSSTRICLTLTRVGARLLRTHRRLPIMAVLTPAESGAAPLSESHLIITAYSSK